MFARRVLSASLRSFPSRTANGQSVTSFARLQRTSASSVRMFSSTGAENTPPTIPTVPTVDIPDVANLPDITPESVQAVVEGIGADAVRELGYTPVDMIIKGIEQVHLLSGMPYWATIIALTVGIRIALLPVAIKTQQAASRLQKIKPDLDRLTNAVKNADTSDSSVRLRYNEEIRHLMTSNKVNPLKALVMPFFQIPIFISFFFALQEIGTYVPAYAEGGMYWFTDLGAADPTLILPAINALSFLGIVELGAETQMSNPYMKNFMRFMGVAMVPITMNMPQGLFFYWISSNAVSVVQMALFRNKTIAKMLDIERPPPQPASTVPSPSPFDLLKKSMADMKVQSKPIQVDAPKTVTGAATTPPPVMYSSNPKKKSKMKNAPAQETETGKKE